MSDISPYSAPKPPKTITKVSDKQFLDFACLHTWILLISVVIALAVFNQIARSAGIVQLTYVALLFAVVVIWIKYFSTFEKVDQQKLRVRFLIDDVNGKHVINKFEVPVTFLEKIVPIIEIHESGIIEFKGNKYGILMETHPVRISEEERPVHEKQIEKVVNGIPANTHFKTIACSRLEPKKPILNYLLEISSKSTGDKATDLHVTGLYNKIAKDNSQVISWKYYAFLSLGEQKNIESARIQYGAVVPGLIKNMKAVRLQPRILDDEEEISMAYRTMFSEVVI